MSDQHAEWGFEMVPVLCESCDWRYLAPEDGLPSVCPHCASSKLVTLSSEEARFPYSTPPELLVPFSVSEGEIQRRIEEFASGIPFPPPDLSAPALLERLQRIFLPMWLVDSDVGASWRAEVGFDYEVVSHQERYADGIGWRTEEVKERRTRWEPRKGRLVRHYDNAAAPALEQHALLQRVLGSHKPGSAVPYRADLVRGATIRAPDLAPEDAWADAQLALRQRALEECRQAARADHIRDFDWEPEYTRRHWTLLLLPVYSTVYLDDEEEPQRVMINGQTGQLHGSRRGSMKRAGRVSLTIGIIAAVLFLLSVALALFGSLFPPLVAVGLVGALIALALGVGAAVPVIQVTVFNRREQRTSLQV
ncbi:MAG: hypothetical protein ACP5HS_07525 [Anaerolineae bacterium]